MDNKLANPAADISVEDLEQALELTTTRSGLKRSNAFWKAS